MARESETEPKRCPVCGGEYVPGIDECVECRVPLIPVAPAEPLEAPPDEPLTLAVEVYSPFEAEVVTSLLQAHDIPCLLKAENQYAVDASYTIGPLARRRILVRRSDLARARDILAAFPLPEEQ